MSDFWARKLGNQQARPARPQTTGPQPWWAPQPVAPQPQPTAAPQPPDELAGHKLPPSAAESDRCPECNSGDYVEVAKAFTPRGAVATKRCFDCGYPVKQQFSGMTAITEGGVTGKAKQVAHGGAVANNFSPQSTQAPAFAAEQGGPGR